MRVLSVASEIYPLVKTGGLADVVGALPSALAREGVQVRTLVPGYAAVLSALMGAEAVCEISALQGGDARLLSGKAAGLDLLVLDAPHLFSRPGGPYGDEQGRDWPDNAGRFAALCKVAAVLGQGLAPGYRPDVIHAHDWQAGLTPAYLHYAGGERPGVLLTVHNLAFQGRFSADWLPELGLPPSAFAIDGVEYYGGIGFLKAGLWFADRITTVSPTYAAEIRAPGNGMGLDGLLQGRSDVLSGILNGIDEEVWNPAADPRLPARFSPSDLGGRALNKQKLQRRLGLAETPDAMLFGVISRLSWQKGIDLLLELIPQLQEQGAQLAVLGAGDPTLEQTLRSAAARRPDAIGAIIGYDEDLAHLIQGGADALLVPSRFEPCGLTQLCALRYGAVPVVARVGGLNDTVIDANEMALAAGVATGVQFAPVSRDALAAAVDRAAALWRSPSVWRRIQANGMACDVGWSGPAKRYAALYRDIVRERRAEGG